MHLRVTCPVCKTEYQVDPSLRGKRMRCPNLICRTVFDIDPSPVSAVSSAESMSAAVSEPPSQTAPTVLAPPEPAAKPAPPPSWATPPPVRNAPPTAPIAAPAVAEPDLPDDNAPSAGIDAPPAPKPARRISPLVAIAVLAVLVAAVGLAIAHGLVVRQGEYERELIARADQSYSMGAFDDAAKQYQILQREVPAAKDRYRFLATLSELRAELDQARNPDELTAVYRHLKQFVDENQADPLAKERTADLADTWSPLAKQLRQAAATSLDAELLRLARDSWQQARRFTTPSASEEAEVIGTFARIEASLDTKTRRAKLLDYLRPTDERLDVGRLEAAERRVKASSFAEDPEVVAAIAAMRQAHRDAVRFRPPAPDRPVAPADDLDLLPLTVPLAEGPALAGPERVYVLSPTGVLYALDPRHGELRWARRLGIDARRLPLPHGDGLIAVLGDRRAVALLDASTGQTRWEHPLESPCVTAPTLVGARLFVPTLAGQLEVVDADNGKGLGIFEIPQTLTEEAALEPGTSRLFVPGNVGFVYVLDIDAKTCVDLIETGHLAGSLVEPIWFAKKSFVLTEAAPGPALRLRPVALPGVKGAAKEFTVAGALAFPAWRDDGVLLMPTPPGKLTQVGHRLPGNADPLLFPLTPFETTMFDASPTRPALVLHADAENVWLLAQGRLQRLQRTFSARTGPGLRIRWAGGVPLGDPLHVGQVHVPPTGLPTLFVPFRNGPVAAAAAVHGETGKILWRSQLGSRPLGELTMLDGGVGWADPAGIFVRDESGKIACRREPPAKHRLLLADGQSFGWTGRTLTVGNRSVELPAAIAGTPAIGPTIGVFPLADGILARVELDTLTVVTGPTWRRADADPESVGTVTALGDDLFLATDAGGSIAAFRWKDRKDWAEVGRVSLAKGRFVGTPARLGPTRLVVRDDTDRLHRLDVDAGKPVLRRSWSADGEIALGPYIVGDRFAIVTTENRLVVFDPEGETPVWQRDFTAELVGPPRLVDGGGLVVADINGNLWLLDAATGRNLGADERRPVWSARPNLAPAVAPMPLPSGDLFIVWSDGTGSVVPRSTWRP
jgi:outer membrane protein assembly factor BamB